MIGSGASLPCMPLAGQIENEIDTLLKGDKTQEANRKKYDFLSGIQNITNTMLSKYTDSNIDESIGNYVSLIKTIEYLLNERKTSIISKQANIFTTNYDLLIEKASEKFSAITINDGFTRNVNLANEFSFSPKTFFNSVSNIGNLYNYKVVIPSINLIKLHGSLSWNRVGVGIKFDTTVKEDLINGSSSDAAEIEKYLEQFAVVLPQQHKFHETVMDSFYYDLLRIYSNELERENTILIVFGFSFVDQHILDVTRRALNNPTLKLIIFAFDSKAGNDFDTKFADYPNVDIIYDGTDTIGFNKFISILMEDHNDTSQP